MSERAVPIVKVCGLVRPEDVALCLALGVEMVGFNCWRGSPRYATPSAVRSALESSSYESSKGSPDVVLVFVRAEPGEVLGVVQALGLPRERLVVQLHGDEDPARYADLGVRLLPVVRVAAALPSGAVPSSGPGRAPPASLAAGRGRVLVDVHAASFGGTGRRIEPEALTRLLPSLPREWVLAGGLDAANVDEAVRRFSPWGVDVASGVEAAPGVKDETKVRAFVTAARGVLEAPAPANGAANASAKANANESTPEARGANETTW